MSWVNDTLSEFGRRMGLELLGFGEHGVAQLVFQSGAVLAVEPVRRGEIDEVLVYLGRPLGFEAARLTRLSEQMNLDVSAIQLLAATGDLH